MTLPTIGGMSRKRAQIAPSSSADGHASTTHSSSAGIASSARQPGPPAKMANTHDDHHRRCAAEHEQLRDSSAAGGSEKGMRTERMMPSASVKQGRLRPPSAEEAPQHQRQRQERQITRAGPWRTARSRGRPARPPSPRSTASARRGRASSRDSAGGYRAIPGWPPAATDAGRPSRPGTRGGNGRRTTCPRSGPAERSAGASTPVPDTRRQPCRSRRPVRSGPSRGGVADPAGFRQSRQICRTPDENSFGTCFFGLRLLADP